MPHERPYPQIMKTWRKVTQIDFSTYINVYQTDRALSDTVKIAHNISDDFMSDYSEMLQNALLSPLGVTNARIRRIASERPYNENGDVSFNLYLSIDDFIDHTMRMIERAEEARAKSATSSWEPSGMIKNIEDIDDYDEEGDDIVW